MFFIKGKNMFF